MTTSHTSSTSPTTERVPLRLTMAPPDDRGPLDGAWWPQSRSLQAELSDLVDHFPPERGRIIRAVFSPPDWDPGSNRVSVRTGFITVGSSQHDDTNVMLVRTSDRREHVLLVIPPDLSQAQGERALKAVEPGYAHSAKTLLAEVSASPED